MSDLWIIFGSALLLDLLLGDPHTAVHPVALFGRYAAWIERAVRSRCGDGIAAGLLAWVIAILPGAALAWITVYCSRRLGDLFPALTAGTWLYFAIAPRSLIEHAEAIRKPLLRGDLAKARQALSRIVSRDTAALDESGIVRGTIESLGENLVDAVTGALFFAALGFPAGGAAGAAVAATIFREINTLDACWGYRNEKYLRFGRIAARADDAANFLPARLTWPVIALAAALTAGAPFQALTGGWRHRHDHPSPNSGYGMAAFAGALRIRLGGPTVYAGKTENYPFWGDGRTVLNASDIRRAERLTAATTVIFTILLAGGAQLWLAVH